MRNIKLLLEYDGTNFHGWAKQPKLRTIEKTIQEAIFQFCDERVNLICASRTDTGVHAVGQVVNFCTNVNLDCRAIKNGLNSLLPKDVVIISAEEKESDFNARFHTKAKHYRYTILKERRSALRRGYTFYIPYQLKLDLMRKESSGLVGAHDFSSFCAGLNGQKNCKRNVETIDIREDKDLVYIDIVADGFLHKMVRNIVGTLIEIGRGKIAPGKLPEILKAKDRGAAGPTAPAHSLCLMEVQY